MKLSINTSFTENTSSQFLLILVDSENTQHLANAYQINDLNNLIEATQFKAAFNETLSLIGQIPTSPNAALVGVGKAAELHAAKLVKIAQTIIKASQTVAGYSYRRDHSDAGWSKRKLWSKRSSNWN